MVLAQEDTVGNDLLQQGDGLAKAPRGYIRFCDGSRTLHVFKI